MYVCMYTFTTTCIAPVFTRHVLNTFHNGSFERSIFYFVVLLIIEAFALETIEGDVRNQLHLTPNGSYVAFVGKSSHLLSLFSKIAVFRAVD